jgi:sugar lactone lactonase YvrE
VRRLLVAAVGLALLTLPAPPTPAAQAAPAKWRTEVFAQMPDPGYPAHVYVHRNGRVYAGSYVAARSKKPSKVFEWSADGELLRSWTVPRQVIGDHGVQAANQTRDGKLLLLETSRAAVLTLDPATGRFRTVARLPEGSVPNYAAWGPGPALYVTDYAQGTVWKVLPATGRVVRWFSSDALEGIAGFGTTGIAYRPGRGDLLVTQQTAAGLLPVNGHLYSIPVRGNGRPGRLRTLWTSRPAELPDGFGIGRSGHIYVALAGLSAQLVELSGSGKELDRFPDTPLSGDNGSPIPFDTPCNATFQGTNVLVANQSAILGNRDHQAILSVEVGERGRTPYLPPGAVFR